MLGFVYYFSITCVNCIHIINYELLLLLLFYKTPIYSHIKDLTLLLSCFNISVLQNGDNTALKGFISVKPTLCMFSAGWPYEKKWDPYSPTSVVLLWGRYHLPLVSTYHIIRSKIFDT